jgi:hypothetical protein
MLSPYGRSLENPTIEFVSVTPSTSQLSSVNNLTREENLLDQAEQIV